MTYLCLGLGNSLWCRWSLCKSLFDWRSTRRLWRSCQSHRVYECPELIKLNMTRNSKSRKNIVEHRGFIWNEKRKNSRYKNFFFVWTWRTITKEVSWYCHKLLRKTLQILKTMFVSLMVLKGGSSDAGLCFLLPVTQFS